MGYCIRFIAGESVGQTFALKDSGALTLGRDPRSDVVLVRDDISKSHIRLETAADGVKLINLSTHTTLVNCRRLAVQEEVSLVVKDTVQLGGMVKFQLLDASEVPASEPQADGDEGTETTCQMRVQGPSGTMSAHDMTRSQLGATQSVVMQQTQEASVSMTGIIRGESTLQTQAAASADDAAEGSGMETIGMSTMWASDEDQKKLRQEEERQYRLRRLFWPVVLLVVVGAAAAYYFALIHQQPETTLGWPMQGDKQLTSGPVSVRVPGCANDIFIQYPKTALTKVSEEPNGMDIETRIGKDGTVPFHMMLEFNQDKRLLTERREASLQRWMKAKAEGANSWNFELPSPVSYWGLDNGVPYVDIYYSRMHQDNFMFGCTSYFRYADVEVALSREIPVTERWRGEAFLQKIFLLFRLSLVHGHWEGTDAFSAAKPEKLLRQAEQNLLNGAQNSWLETFYLLNSALCQSQPNSEVRRQAQAALTQLRASISVWYNLQLLSFKRAKLEKAAKTQKEIKKRCMELFSQLEDSRYHRVCNDEWGK